MKKILITGGSGFFGTNAARMLRSQGYTVVCTSQDPSKYETFKYFQEHPLYPLNIQNSAQINTLLEQTRPDVIIHAAALSAPLYAEQNPDHTFAINVEGTRSVLNAAQNLDIPVVFLSSDLVFNGNKNVVTDGFYNEGDTPDARIVYGKSKIAAEQVLQEHSFRKWIILRASLMFGGYVESANGFPQFAINLLKTRQNATLFIDQYRTPAYVPDICTAALHLVENSVQIGEKSGKHDKKNQTTHSKNYWQETFHIGGNERIDRVSFVQRCCAVFGIETSYILAKRMDEVPNYTTRVHDVSLDSTKLCTALAFNWQQTPLEAAFEEMRESFCNVI